MVSVDDADPLDRRDTLAGVNVSTGPAGEIAEVSDIVPLRPLRLKRVTADAPHCPCWMDKLLGKRLTVKSALELVVVKVAVCTFSGIEVGPPFVIVTQIGGWLVTLEQPVWNPSPMPEAIPVTL